MKLKLNESERKSILSKHIMAGLKTTISEQSLRKMEDFIPFEADAEYKSMNGTIKKTKIKVTEIYIQTDGIGSASLKVKFWGFVGDKLYPQEYTYYCLNQKMKMDDPEAFCRKDENCKSSDDVDIKNAGDLFSKYCPSM